MAKKQTEELLAGHQTVNLDFRPDVPADALALLNPLGITDVSLIKDYKITSHEDKAEVFRIVQTAAIRIDQIEKGYADQKS